VVEHLFQRNQRKLPIDILKKQQTIEKEMREKILMAKPLASNEAQERDAKIKAILANIPCMSPETL
jgi:hydroxymethylglutaryl-CoA reductase